MRVFPSPKYFLRYPLISQTSQVIHFGYFKRTFSLAVVVILKSWQTRTHCCGHIVADTNVSPFARVRSICCGQNFCVRDTKNVSDFVQKHIVSATNVSQFAQHKKHYEQQCVCNNVSSFASKVLSTNYVSETGLVL